MASRITGKLRTNIKTLHHWPLSVLSVIDGTPYNGTIMRNASWRHRANPLKCTGRHCYRYLGDVYLAPNHKHDDVIKRKHFPRHWPKLCVGNSPVTGEFPSQRPATWSFDVFFYLRLNKWLSKQSRCRWFETPSRSKLRHSNDEMDNDRIAIQLSSVISVYSSSRQWLIKSSMAFEAFTRYHMLTNGAVSINTVPRYITTYGPFI